MSIVIVYKCENEAKLHKVINHEKNHVVNIIMEWANIHDIEASAFLDGYISEKLFSSI